MMSDLQAIETTRTVATQAAIVQEIKPMKPDLEVVQIGRAESFKAWEHGYPFRTVRWHFHTQ